MAIPYREWTQFYIRGLEGFNSANNFSVAAAWTATHYGTGKIGLAYPIANEFYKWDAIIRPTADDFALLDGMDEMIDCQFEHELLYEADQGNAFGMNLRMYFMDDPPAPDTWDEKIVSGRYYDNVHQWSNYPECGSHNVQPDDPTIPHWNGYINVPFNHINWRHVCKICSMANDGATAESNLRQVGFFRSGLIYFVGFLCNSGGGTKALQLGDNVSYYVHPHKFNVRYFNPVVNSLSRYYAPAAGGVEVKLYGLGFDMADAEISDTTRHPDNAIPAGGWGHVVEDIYFEGLQNQGQYHLNRTGGDFTVDSNLQITIPANKFPAMAAGTYNIRLRLFVEDVGEVRAWAGDWNCEADGRVSVGTRIVFYVGDLSLPTGGDYLICGGYAPIDIRTFETGNLVLNGGFADTSEWTRSDTTITLASIAGGVSGNCLRITSGVAGAGKYAYQEIGGLAIGEKYHFHGFHKLGTASGGFIKVGTTQGGDDILSRTALTDADFQIYPINFTATTTSIFIGLGIEENSKTVFFDEVMLYSAPAFYDGRILSQSSLRRAIDDTEGLGAVSDMEMTLANSDKHFSILAYTDYLKNDAIEAFHAWRSEIGPARENVFSGVIDDFKLKGELFSISLKDITNQYFQQKVPRQICTEDEYPNIHEDEIGKRMPEILGKAYFATTQAKGAVRAIYIDTVNFKYLAAAGPLTTITEVYVDGESIPAPGNWGLSYDEHGRTYIDFDEDQGEKAITFNALGYSYVDWDSVNDYVQNPAYIRLYFLAFICGVRIAHLDIASFDIMADYYETLGEETSGYLILQDECDPGDVLQELSITYGDTGYIAKDGRYTLGKKTLSDFTAELILFSQVDLLDHPEWQPQYTEMVNYINGKYNFYPASSGIFTGANAMTYEASKDDLGGTWVTEEMEFKWTTSSDMVWRRLAEELLKRGYGNRKVAFSVSIDHLDELDLFTNLKLQDPFAISADGSGDAGRYVYIESMNVDWQARRIDIIGADYTWLMAFESGSGLESLA